MECQGSQVWDTESHQGQTRESIKELSRVLQGFKKYLFIYTCVGSTSICMYIRETTSIGEDMVVMGQGGEGEFLGLLTM